MEQNDAVTSLSALAHGGRLEIFRLLVKAGPGGMPAGKIAEATGTLPNTLSASLTLLSNAGLVHSRRDGRSVIYSPDYQAMSGLLAFLMEDCCSGEPAICAPLADIARTSACAPGACS